VARGPADDLRWWTWAGYRANATLAATLARAGLADPAQRVSPLFIRLRGDLRATAWPAAVRALGDHLRLPDVDDKAVAGLKFSAALPRGLAVATLATRLADFDHAAAVLAAPVRFERQP
jgi:ATP-dependent Lhr-like helicase